MVAILSTWNGPNPKRRAALVLIPALLIGIGLGCGHRRSAMRPVYVTPAPTTSAPCTNCGGGAAPSAVTTPSTSSGSTLTTEPPLTGPSVAEPSANVPLLDNATRPAAATPSTSPSPGASPARSNSAPNDEPPLDLTPASGGSSTNERPPTAAPGPKGPTSLRSNSTRGTGTIRPTGGSLRERLRSRANDPDDLFLPPKAERPWKYVVLHHSARAEGSYDQIDHEHRDSLGWDGCGYHFIIGNGTGSPDGSIEVARRWSEQKHGIHCRNARDAAMSEYGIGICLVGDLDHQPPTPRQVAAARDLIAYLSDRYHIPANHVATHEHVASASNPTACPGKLFPSQAILGTSKVAR